MNKTSISLTIFLILLFSQSYAQITLNATNTPQPNSRYVFYKVDWGNTQIDTVGVNIIWDFSTLTILNDSIEKIYTKDTSYNSFPGSCYSDYPSNFDTTLIRTYNEIYQLIDSNYTLSYRKPRYHGGGGSTCVKQVNHTKLFFPFSYTNTIHENWSYGDGTGHIDVNAIEYGTLILPDTTYNNTLLIRTEFKDYHDFNTQSNHISNNDFIDITYDWYTSNSEVPVLSYTWSFWIENYYMGPSPHYNTTANVYFKKENIITDIKPISNETIINIYPNPTSNQLTIDTELNINEVTIIDITGKIIMTTKRNTNTINVTDLLNGIYFIKLVTEDRTITKKFVKQ